MSKYHVYTATSKRVYERYIRNLLTGEKSLHIDSIGDTMFYFRMQANIKHPVMASLLKMNISCYKNFEEGIYENNFMLSEYFEKYCEVVGIDRKTFIIKLKKIFVKNSNEIFDSVFGKKL